MPNVWYPENSYPLWKAKRELQSDPSPLFFVWIFYLFFATSESPSSSSSLPLFNEGDRGGSFSSTSICTPSPGSKRACSCTFSVFCYCLPIFCGLLLPLSFRCFVFLRHLFLRREVLLCSFFCFWCRRLRRVLSGTRSRYVSDSTAGPTIGTTTFDHNQDTTSLAYMPAPIVTHHRSAPPSPTGHGGSSIEIHTSLSTDDAFTIIPDDVEAHRISNNYLFGFKKWKSHISTRPVENRSEIVQDLYSDINKSVLPVRVSTVRPSNILYVLFIGWWLALIYALIAVVMFLTYFGRSYGFFCLKMARYFLWPFGFFVHLVDTPPPLELSAEVREENNRNMEDGERQPNERTSLLKKSRSAQLANERWKYWYKPKTYLWFLLGVPILMVCHILVFIVTWLLVITIPIAKINSKTIRKVLFLPPEHIDICNSNVIPKDNIRRNGEIIMYTHQSLNIYYYKYTVDDLHCSKCEKVETWIPINGSSGDSSNSSAVGMQCSQCSQSLFGLDGDTTLYDKHILPLVYTCALLLPISYIIGLIFSMKTHFGHVYHEFYDQMAEEGSAHRGHHHGAPQWSRIKCIIILFISTVLISLLADIMANNLQPLMESLKMSEYFIGVTLIAILPELPEVVNGIQFALQNNVAMGIEIAINTSIQCCLLQVPLLILINLIYPFGLYMIFSDVHMFAVIFAVIVMNYTLQDGRSNYFQGSALLLIYFVLMAMYYFTPTPKVVQC
ncbi:unnamed protein product [Acanthosepion pharaonis]|uniref:Uncharacterized protein n=1 Tax=Acanthosepion pharaonis TaxID=158019 RepID=A0A812B157_ACAPH|nr:unnamed protein product [Sepia pharaonis]